MKTEMVRPGQAGISETKNHRVHLKITVISVFLSLFFIHISGSSTFVRNRLPEIEACEGKINLSLTRIWGDDQTEDENQFFRFPMDIKIDNKNLVYIVDSGNNRVQVFDRKGVFKHTIGRIGQGPGDLLLPRGVDFDKSGNLFAADHGNCRVQVFDPRGKYLDSFRTTGAQPTYIALTGKNEIALYSYEQSFKSGNLITLYNRNGKVLKEIGKLFRSPKSLLNTESVFFTIDRNNSFYVSFYATPCYIKYSYEGDPELAVTFEVPFKTPRMERNKAKKNIKIGGEGEERVCSGISIDKSGNFYLVASTRPMRKEERYFLVSDGKGTMRRYPKGPYPESTDRFRLLVFSPRGKVIAVKELNVSCDAIYVHEDSLFVIDTYMGMKIYEYRLSFGGCK